MIKVVFAAFALVTPMFCAYPVFATGVDFEACRKAIEVNENEINNTDLAPGAPRFTCSVKVLSKQILPPGSGCVATVDFITTCKSSASHHSYEGGACCPFD